MMSANNDKSDADRSVNENHIRQDAELSPVIGALLGRAEVDEAAEAETLAASAAV